MATRFLSRARMDPKKAVKLMRETHEWRKAYFKDGPIKDDDVMEDMKHGIVYFIGRDSALRPAIVVRAKRIPQQWYKEKRIDKFIRILIFCMEYFARYMVVPGRVENLNVIVDLQGLGISQVPIGALAEVYSVLSHHYIGRVHKFYACNVSYLLNTIAGLAKGLLTDRQKQKLNVLDDVRDLRKDFALHQLECDMGGTRPIVADFFPFPVGPGPFDAGFAGGPDRDAPQGAHEALTANGVLGRLWHPRLSAHENARLEYGPRAAAVFERCGFPVPAEARFEQGGEQGCGHAEAVARASSGASTEAGTPFDDTPLSLDEAMPSPMAGFGEDQDLAVDVGEVERVEVAKPMWGGGFVCCHN
mmetsp:Transcript_38528/g.116493  ORF Transcript_38528/g.116493 Transcript_38528/m.116493 type:complete len:359 (-) Transcript_38528:5-1081(-)